MESQAHLVYVEGVEVVVRAIALVISHPPHPRFCRLAVVPPLLEGDCAIVPPPVLCQVWQDLGRQQELQSGNKQERVHHFPNPTIHMAASLRELVLEEQPKLHWNC